MFVGVIAMHTYIISVNFTPLIAHITLSVTHFFLLSLSINCDSNKSVFISLGNSDVRPDPEFGNHPIQLEHINEKSCTIHAVSTEDTVLGISSVTFYLAWLAVLAGTSNTVVFVSILRKDI